MELNIANQQASAIKVGAEEVLSAVRRLEQYRAAFTEAWVGRETAGILMALDRDVAALRRISAELTTLAADVRRAALELQAEEAAALTAEQ